MAYIATGTNGDRTVYGTGDSAEDAIQDAIANGDASEGDEDQKGRYETMPCTVALHAQVLDGDLNYIVRDHHAYTAAEAEAVDEGLDVDDEGIATGTLELSDEDADRLGVNDQIDVMITSSRMTVSYETLSGDRREIAEEPADPEAQELAYGFNLKNVYAAIIGLLESAVARDAENAEAA